MAAPISTSISAIRDIVPAGIPSPAGQPARPGEFGRALSDALREVETTRTEANQKVERFLSGQGEELHGTILAAQRAEMTFELFLQTRNKVVQAYQEMMRMQM